jgi:hypothetical protein
MVRWATLLTAIALAACGELAQTASEPAQAVCAARAAAPWRPLRGMEFQVSAEAVGPTCGAASATLSIADASGRALYRETLPAAQIMTLAYSEDEQAMQAALSEWIDPTNSSLRTSSELPVWRAEAEQPVLGEFPFYPEIAFGREAYAALRARDAPLFCFVQGMESLACLALEGDALTKVGVQTFPG